MFLLRKLLGLVHMRESLDNGQCIHKFAKTTTAVIIVVCILNCVQMSPIVLYISYHESMFTVVVCFFFFSDFLLSLLHFQLSVYQ